MGILRLLPVKFMNGVLHRNALVSDKLPRDVPTGDTTLNWLSELLDLRSTMPRGSSCRWIGTILILNRELYPLLWNHPPPEI